jgi:hypothetical protein
MDCSERNFAILMRFRQAKENAATLLKGLGRDHRSRYPRLAPVLTAGPRPYLDTAVSE